MKEKASRFNSGKNRLELIDSWVMDRLGEVLTHGAEKYELQNWRNGLSFLETIGSLKRHISKFEKGSEDYDRESGLHHLAHGMANIMFLLYYVKYHPEMDDRHIHTQAYQSVGYDIDDVLLDFCGGWKKEFNLPESWEAKSWYNKQFSAEQFETLSDDFWLNLKPKLKPEFLYTPTVYVTSRSGQAKELTQQWLDDHGFPRAPIVFSDDKAKVCNDYELDMFFDDRLKHYFNILNHTSTKPYLINMAHNQSVSVANRIFSIEDAIEFKQ
jgi:hypothetical protein